MKKVIALASLLTLVAGTAMALDVAKLPDVTVEGMTTYHGDMLRDGSVLVVSVTVGTFTDGSAAYVDALTAAGCTADLIYDPQTTGWPDLSGYDGIVVVYNDVWWDSSLGAFGPADTAVLAGFAGSLGVVGQDFVYSLGSGFVTSRFGVTSVIEDINFGDASVMTITGLAGSPYDGMSASGVPCWAANPWFTDDISAGTEGHNWVGGAFSGQGAAIVGDGIFSGNAYECLTGDDFISAMAGYLFNCTGVPTEESSWSTVKGLYR
jgi:hypothetical protein